MPPRGENEAYPFQGDANRALSAQEEKRNKRKATEDGEGPMEAA